LDSIKMKFNELTDMMQKPEPKPDTYEAGMALNQLLKIGTHAIKIHNMIDDDAEMEAWVAKKIDLASNYVKSVHGYTAGSKAGTYDDDGMSESREQIGDYAREIKSGRIVRIVDYTDDDEGIYTISYGEDKGENDVTAKDLKFLDQTGGDQEEIGKFDEDEDKDVEKAKQIAKNKAGDMTGASQDIDTVKKGLSKHPDVADALKRANEDAGEGHMSKSQLYQTAKMSIELLDMIKKGDDLEGWVQTKLNLAADYLQAVYHYEDYQKLNPYREELDGALIQRHAGIIQKHLDEILERKCRTEDVDTKPGMMRILKKRVNEVEKEIAKENRKNTDEVAPPGREKQVKKLKGKFKDKGAPYAIAWAQHNKHGKPKKEAVLDEGIKDWARNLAMAGVIVAGLAGINSINDAIDRSIPAVQAMETALELAQDQGNTELADMIKKDLSAVKVRLSSGKDLGFVKGMQEKYSKFVKTEALAYESKLAVMLDQRIK